MAQIDHLSIDEARFIRLWQDGLTTAAIAQALGIPPGTARSRVYALQQGKIQARPKRGRRVRSTTAHPGTPEPTMRDTAAHPSPPASQSTPAHRGTPHFPAPQPTAVHPRYPSPTMRPCACCPCCPTWR